MTDKLSFFIFTALFLLAFCCQKEVSAQHFCRLSANDFGQQDKDIAHLLRVPEVFDNENMCRMWLNQLLYKVHKLGYLEAGYRSWNRDIDTTFADLFIGKKWQVGHFRRGNIPPELFSELKLDKAPELQDADVTSVADMLDRIVTWHENHGWPFCAVRLDSISYTDKCINAAFNLVKGPYCSVDSILIVGDAAIAPVYLYHYLGISPGTEYNESIVSEIDTRLEELPFIRKKQNTEIIFTQETTKIKLYLEKKTASYIDGVAGVQPDPSGQGVRITGDIRFKLLNALHKGEQIGVNWSKLQEQTFSLLAGADIPYIFNLPFGLGGTLDIYRKDTTYTTVKRKASFSYLLRRGAYVSLSYQFDQSNLISTNGLSTISVLPEIADIKFNGYGLTAGLVRLDYRLNPRRGWEAKMSAEAGTKQILKNPGLPEVLYDSAQLRSSRFSGEWAGAFYIPVGKRSTIKTGTMAAYLHSEQTFTNELYRIGGIHYFRGFEEESILASAYSVLSVEYRYLLEKNSFVQVFWDGAYYENTAVDLPIYGTPYGFGAGISMGTKAGIFNLSYALGQHHTNRFTNDLSLKSGRLHFGFYAQF